MEFLKELIKNVNQQTEDRVNKKFIGVESLDGVRIDLRFKDLEQVKKNNPNIDIVINAFFKGDELKLLDSIEKEIKKFRKELKKNE